MAAGGTHIGLRQEMLFAVGHSKERRDPREGAVLPQPKKQSKNRLLNPCRCRLSVVSAILSLVFFSAFPGFPVLTAAAESAENPAGKLPTLTTARAAHSLTIEEANRAYPV